MELEIKELKKRDEKKAIEFAITGMHFRWYFDSDFMLQTYAHYFWYKESGQATQIIAAYSGETLAGVLLARIYGRKPARPSLYKRLYVTAWEFLTSYSLNKSAGIYISTSEKMLKHYQQYNTPDGEMLFLAVNPELRVKGIGTKLLEELAKRERGKKIFLQTESACAYQFYDHRGFDRAEEEHIVLDFGKRKVPLTCFLYSKIL